MRDTDKRARLEQPAAFSQRSLGRRLLWFAIYWAAGVAAVGALAFVLRAVLR
jgi:hypothetical protein